MDKFIFHVPEWNPDMYFTPEHIVFVLIIVALVFGLWGCIWGYRYFLTLVLLVLGCGCAFLSIRWFSNRFGNSFANLAVFIMFIDFAMCILYVITTMISARIERGRARKVLKKVKHILAPLMGMAVIFCTLYFGVLRDVVMDGVIAAVCFVLGMLYQEMTRGEKKDFHTYEDIYYEESKNA